MNTMLNWFMSLFRNRAVNSTKSTTRKHDNLTISQVLINVIENSSLISRQYKLDINTAERLANYKLKNGCAVIMCQANCNIIELLLYAVNNEYYINITSLLRLAEYRDEYEYSNTIFIPILDSENDYSHEELESLSLNYVAADVQLQSLLNFNTNSHATIWSLFASVLTKNILVRAPQLIESLETINSLDVMRLSEEQVKLIDVTNLTLQQLVIDACQSLLDLQADEEIDKLIMQKNIKQLTSDLIKSINAPANLDELVIHRKTTVNDYNIDDVVNCESSPLDLIDEELNKNKSSVE